MISLPIRTPSLLHMIPFVGVLLSLSLAPLCAPAFWHQHEKKILSFWCIAGITSLLHLFSVSTASYLFIETLWKDYVPFIALLFALYTISGGIKIDVNLNNTPFTNVIVLTVASCFASFIGTTGTSMLFIRPLLQLNKGRLHKTHIVIFFIIIVSNVAGALTPLGDPPLFLGYLEGVPFFWTMIHLYQPFLLMLTSLLGVFYLCDRWYYKKETHENSNIINASSKKINISGYRNFGILAIVIFLVAFMQNLPEIQWLKICSVPIQSNEVFFTSSLFGLGILSHFTSSAHIHRQNHFHFAPVKEVSLVFLCIFITLIPVNKMLDMRLDGPFHAVLKSLMIQNPEKLYFWLTGLFSSILDNAPTYLVFIKLSGLTITELTSIHESILMAISMGAVFMGALTYIGNAPNFMVLSIAKQYNVKMPSFLTYFLIACAILIPLFVVISLIWL